MHVNAKKKRQNKHCTQHLSAAGEGEILSAPTETRCVTVLRRERLQLAHVLHEDAVQTNLSNDDTEMQGKAPKVLGNTTPSLRSWRVTVENWVSTFDR